MSEPGAFTSTADEKPAYKHSEATAYTATDGVDGTLLKHEAYLQAQHLTLQQKKPFLQVLRENKKAIVTAISMQTSGCILGCEVILVSALVGNQAFIRVMSGDPPVDGTYSMPAWILSLWAGIFNICQVIGFFFGGWCSDRFGRMPTMYLSPLLIYAGAITELTSRNRWDFLGAKIIMGCAAGLTQSVYPTYVAEIAPREIRGVLVGGGWSLFFNLGAFIGTLLCYAGNQGFPDPMDNRGWKVPLYVGVALPTITLTFQLFLLRESPYWLTLHNKLDKAKQSLRFIYSSKTEEEIDGLANELVYTVAKEKQDAYEYKDTTYADLFRGIDLRRTFVACFPNVALQMAGNMLQSSYSTYFFEVAGVTNALLGSSMVTMCGLIGGLTSWVALETIGRYPLLLAGVIVETISMLIIGMVNSIQHGNISTAGGMVLVVACAVFNFTSAVGPGVCGASYAGEAGSARLRAKTNSFSLMLNGLLGGIWQTVLPYQLDAIGPNTGYMFFGFGLICILITVLYVPDLTGLTYAQMDELFHRKIDSRRFLKTECTGVYGNNVDDDD